ncbi:MAG: phage head closure protein [Alphaproteobacteria bacterium]|nr:phage head closure protein [Alphaproteobacteria bacterium]
MSFASLLRERVRIEQLVAGDDGYGGQVLNWGELATVFAQVEPIFIGQSERASADQRSANAGYRVRIRLRTDLDASMRIVWKSHVLSIHSLHEQGEILSILTYEENL